jgi:hypothetical protein
MADSTLDHPSPPFSGSVHSRGFTLFEFGSAHFKRLAGWALASLLAEAADKGKGIADHGVVGTRMPHGSINFIFYGGYGLE